MHVTGHKVMRRNPDIKFCRGTPAARAGMAPAAGDVPMPAPTPLPVRRAILLGRLPPRRLAGRCGRADRAPLRPAGELAEGGGRVLRGRLADGRFPPWAGG